MLITKLMTSKL